MYYGGAHVVMMTSYANTVFIA